MVGIFHEVRCNSRATATSFGGNMKQFFQRKIITLVRSVPGSVCAAYERTHL